MDENVSIIFASFISAEEYIYSLALGVEWIERVYSGSDNFVDTQCVISFI